MIKLTHKTCIVDFQLFFPVNDLILTGHFDF